MRKTLRDDLAFAPITVVLGIMGVAGEEPFMGWVLVGLGVFWCTALVCQMVWGDE